MEKEIKIVVRMAVVRGSMAVLYRFGAACFCLDGVQGRAGKCIQ